LKNLILYNNYIDIRRLQFVSDMLKMHAYIYNYNRYCKCVTIFFKFDIVYVLIVVDS